METESIDKLFLELSQVTKARTAREIELEEALHHANDMCRSAMAIANRDGDATNWEGFRGRLAESLLRQHQVIMPRGKEHPYGRLKDVPKESEKCQRCGGSEYVLDLRTGESDPCPECAFPR
jgi:hypothetical protein